MNSDDFHAKRFFFAGGAMSPHEPSYVARSCDKEALNYLFQQRYVSILGPRQVGKTSLLNKLHVTLHRADIPSAIIDLSPFTGAGVALAESGFASRAELAAAWYLELAQAIDDQLASSSGSSDEVRDLRSFSRFLNQLDVVAAEESHAVIILDEAASVPDSLKTEFFMRSRTLFNTRSNIGAQAASRFTFVFAGAFYPSALVTNPNVSPFNVSEAIYLPDFTRAEVDLLLKGFESEGVFLEPAAAEHVWESTRGHPFLTQRLCASLSSRARALEAGGGQAIIRREDVEDAARTIGDHDPHLHNLVQRLDDSPTEVELIRRVVMDNEFVPFSRLVNPAAAQLEMIGALSEDHGFARVRNPIYGRVLRDYLSART